ncbi:hypothetical protein [Tropicibacter alexandrii]|uniref:hypothetical protein n=1 Tax=Tropicibacter alexandrii TaxID=2267683 RepID=UPI000EF44F0D|nr:hypothetical protein [Tropicibacter alexandrii]
MTNEQTRNEQFRAAIEEITAVVRKHPGTGGGQVLMKILISLAFRVQVPIDLGAVSYHFGSRGESATRNATLVAISNRAMCNWPDDILPDDEIRGWISHWKIPYDDMW